MSMNSNKNSMFSSYSDLLQTFLKLEPIINSSKFIKFSF